MGVFRLFGSHFRDSSEPDQLVQVTPVSDYLIRVGEVGHFVVAKVMYSKCPEYEREKILVYRGTRADLKGKNLDPHFSEKGFSPIARFQPTDEGWNDAIAYAKYKEASE